MDQSKLVVELAMEIALPSEILESIGQTIGPQKARECAMSTSVGGIGPLLKDRILGASDVGLNVLGVSLLYEYVWVQRWHEWGQFNLEKRDVGDTLRKFLKKADFKLAITGFDGQPIEIDVWMAAYGNAPVYFLSVPRLTNVVYPGPRDLFHSKENPAAWSHTKRLEQSWILGRGTLALLKHLNLSPAITIISETPTIFGHHRLVKDEFQNDPLFNNVSYIFNDHTPLEYAHPIWDTTTIERVKMDAACYTNSPGWNSSKKTLDITSLLVGLCEGVYGVAKKHGEVMRAMASLKKFGPKIEHITNGVRKEVWQAPGFRDWKVQSDDQLLKEKQKLKEQLITWVWRQNGLWPQWAKTAESMHLVVLTRRITPYKRMDMLTRILSTPALRDRFLKLNIIVLLGGRIHQEDTQAQDMVYALIDLVDKDERLRDRVIFIDNFNVWEAPLLYHGASGSIMLADDTREASATGFMKAQMNGAAIIATDDGAVPEFVIFETNGGDNPAVNGYKVPYVNGQPTPEGLMEAFEAFDRAYATPESAARHMRAALAMTDALDIARTVKEMVSLYDRLLSVKGTPA